MSLYKHSFLSVFLTFITLVSCHRNTSMPLTIAAAANMQFAVKNLTQAFTATTGIPCQISIGSSGKLSAQIQQGAPFDIFLAADMHYPTVLYQKKHTHNAPEVYAQGSLILWTLRSDITPTLAVLTHPNIQHIAIPNPKTAPYGRAAASVLEDLGLTDTLQSKLVYGESIGQTSQFIASQAVDIGFTAKSIIEASEFKNKGHWTPISPQTHSPIAQGVVLLNTRKTRDLEAKKFYNFLFSSTGKTILNTSGFTTTLDGNKNFSKAAY